MNSEALRALRLYLARTKFTDQWPKNRCGRMWLTKMLNCFLKAFFLGLTKGGFRSFSKTTFIPWGCALLQVSPFQTQRLLFPWKNCRETDEMNKLIRLGSITISVSIIDKRLLSLPLLLNCSPSADLGCCRSFPGLDRGEQFYVFHKDSFLLQMCQNFLQNQVPFHKGTAIEWNI